LLTDLLTDFARRCFFLFSAGGRRDLHQRDDRRFYIRVVKPEWVWDCIERGGLEDPKAEHRISLAS